MCAIAIIFFKNILFRESIEDGFSSSRLVVTADLAGDNDNQHPYFNSYPGMSTF